MKKIVIMILIVVVGVVVYGHGGRTDSKGCHLNKKTGERHCH